MVNWYSLFSHTGKETECIRDMLRDKLKLVHALTNNVDYDGELDVIKFRSGADINTWLMEPGHVEPNSITTLNGYMRILPKEVLEYLASINCKVYNIHPAPIQLYPELKGADPQERMWDGLQSGKYQLIGVVIHEVNAGVDTGKIVHWVVELPTDVQTKDGLYERLHSMGFDAWFEFFEERMYENG